jgi:ribosome-associated toxin RatA of RatAB toxin-antitoxin module
MKALRSRLACLACAVLPGAALAADDISVSAHREADAVHVSARASLRAPRDLVWDTLTDYDRLHDFIPGMRTSRVIGRRGAAVIVEQRGEARFLVFSYPIEVTVASVQRPPYLIEIHLLRGNLRKLDGAYRIEPLPAGRLILRWEGTIVPALALPSVVSQYLIRASVEDQFLGMVREIERRDEARVRGTPPRR